MMWYYWLAIIMAIIIVCVVLGAYWWKKWHEMMLRMEYGVIGFLLGAITVFVLLLVFGKIEWA